MPDPTSRARRHVQRGGLATPFALLLTFAISATTHGATAVVPTQHATIQAAVNAVQGTPDALVRIDSNDTFVETVIATQSVAIAAGSGFTPTVQAASATCAGACIISLHHAGTAAASYRLEGLRLVSPAALGSVDHLVRVVNDGSSTLALTVERTTLEAPAGVLSGGVFAQANGTGTNLVTLRDSSLRSGGTPGQDKRAIRMDIRGALTLERVRIDMSGANSLALDIRGEFVVIVRDSSLDVAAPQAPLNSYLGQLVGSILARFERNHLTMRRSELGRVNGIDLTSTNGADSSIVLDSNEFVSVGAGGRIDPALELKPQAESTVAATVVDNVLRGASFALAPASGSPGGTATAQFVNNTVDGSTRSGLEMSLANGSSTTVALYNNLFTGSAQHGVAASPLGGALAANGGHNGFFGNLLGDLDGPLVLTDSVFADPLYVGGGDTRLRVGSPMLDAGDNNAVIDLPFDHAGNSRIQGGIVDIGAFEGGVSALVEVPALDALGLCAFALVLAAAASIALRR